MKSAAEEIAVQAIQYQLLEQSGVEKATLYRVGKLTPNALDLLLILENDKLKKDFEEFLLFVTYKMSASGLPLKYSLKVITQKEFTASSEFTLIHHWDSFDPKLREQLRRWGSINSPLGYRGGWLAITGVLVFILIFTLVALNFFGKL
jgi:hypothetical protein